MHDPKGWHAGPQVGRSLSSYDMRPPWGGRAFTSYAINDSHDHYSPVSDAEPIKGQTLNPYDEPRICFTCRHVSQEVTAFSSARPPRSVVARLMKVLRQRLSR